MIIIPNAKTTNQKMYTRGEYEHKWPIGAVIHSSASRDDVASVIDTLLDNKLACLVIGRDGTIYQSFDITKKGFHCGTIHHNSHVGIEIISAGKVNKLGYGMYAPWYNVKPSKNNLDIIIDTTKLLKESDVREVTFISKKQISGAYHKFTDEQEKSLIELLIFLYRNAPNSCFQIDNILGHDEVCFLSDQEGRKTDPGGCLSVSMDTFRDRLKRLISLN